MRTHTYTCAKGYADQYKGREIKWQVPETMEEAISSGEFKDERTLVRYATAQLNIRKGHAVQDATKETIGGEGPDKDNLKNTNMTTAALETIAAGVKADGTERTRSGGGSQKVKAEKLDTAKQKAAQIAQTNDPAKLALLRELGLLDEEPTAAPAATETKPAAKARR
jgi:hypothetical protein